MLGLKNNDIKYLIKNRRTEKKVQKKLQIVE